MTVTTCCPACCWGSICSATTTSFTRAVPGSSNRELCGCWVAHLLGWWVGHVWRCPATASELHARLCKLDAVYRPSALLAAALLGKMWNRCAVGGTEQVAPQAPWCSDSTILRTSHVKCQVSLFLPSCAHLLRVSLQDVRLPSPLNLRRQDLCHFPAPARHQKRPACPLPCAAAVPLPSLPATHACAYLSACVATQVLGARDAAVHPSLRQVHT